MNPISSAPQAVMPQSNVALPSNPGLQASDPGQPIVKPSEVVAPKQAQIVLDTSGMSAASVRESARPVEKVVQAAADAIQTFIQSKGVNLNISVDHTTGYHIIRVTDNSGNMVMQLPSEEAVRIAHNMDSLQGVFVDHIA
ncbi:flagellar protein FlaG [Polynucleobacter corsicus]|uniref:flagellar protein FlaG n=1 Tax=Polynucleobacter corsicus TaxID=2081042 RepID=UPI001BFE0590|nr:flagellar protein FlaG [Polynucleobacter corsicus]QWE19306.1 flagellar protein FlaG [Polynucleobacter corsicus]